MKSACYYLHGSFTPSFPLTQKRSPIHNLFFDLALAGLLSLSLSACTDADEAAEVTSGLLVTLQPSDSVAAPAGSYSVSVFATQGGAQEVAKASLASATGSTVIDLAPGAYTILASAFAAGDTSASIASATGSFTVEKGKTGAVALALRFTDGPVLSSITASSGAPRNQELITLTALYGSSPATGGTFTWEENCRGEFAGNSGTTVVWSNNWAEDSPILFLQVCRRQAQCLIGRPADRISHRRCCRCGRRCLYFTERTL